MKRAYRNHTYSSLGLQNDGHSCGFWSATIALLLALGVNVEAAEIIQNLKQLGTDAIKKFWVDAATEFIHDEQGVQRQTVVSFLVRIDEKLGHMAAGNKCVRIPNYVFTNHVINIGCICLRSHRDLLSLLE